MGCWWEQLAHDGVVAELVSCGEEIHKLAGLNSRILQSTVAVLLVAVLSIYRLHYRTCLLLIIRITSTWQGK